MIEVKDISKVYGEQRAVDHATFSVKKGEIVGLLGPNGAGKSTLMKILTCFIPPTDGDATVCGHSIFDDTLAVRRCIGYLPEHNPLYLDMYVREYLRFAAGLGGVKNSTERADEMIELTGLTPEANKRIGQLSKGYRQRVGLAQAMIHDPQVLILDEPTTGLDPNQLEFIRGVIRNAGKNKAVLLSTHIMQEVEAMCSRAIIMGHGKILADENISGLTANKLTEQFHKLTM
ncbi:MAG: ATP-binding cassette domain-containing protein [Bacteroidales bacterium]|nr:ATP-binding cassette domain-containing protein [Bacteroidales bacterium]